MATSNDSSALATPETIVIDGANGVTRAPREHFPNAGWELLIALVATGVALVFRKNRRVLPALLLIAALPGFLHVFWKRADAPLNRGSLAAQVRSTMREFAKFAPWPRDAVKVVHEDDDVLFPLLRYARPTRPSSDGGITMEVRGSSLRVKCSVVARHITCRSGP